MGGRIVQFETPDVLPHPVGDLEHLARRLLVAPARTSNTQPVRAGDLELIASHWSHSGISDFRPARPTERRFH